MKTYCREPLQYQENIPVFSNVSEYTENYKKIANDALTAIRKTGNNPWMNEELWVELEDSTSVLIEKYSKPRDKILDVGVGLGRLLARFPELQRYGLDISMDFLKESQSKGIDVCYSLIEDIPYSQEFFDVIVCTDVLEHVLDLNQCCTKILKTLKPGGFLIIRTPYKENLDPYLDPSYPYTYVHLRNFDIPSYYLFFSKIIEDCQVIETTFSVYQEDYIRLKYHSPLPKGDYFLHIFLKLVKKIDYSRYQSLIRSLYEPIEINVVVQKQRVINGE